MKRYKQASRCVQTRNTESNRSLALPASSHPPFIPATGTRGEEVMAVELERRSVLVVADAEERAVLRPLFARGFLQGWSVLEASSFAQARFALQHDACDVILVDEGLYRREDRT